MPRCEYFAERFVCPQPSISDDDEPEEYVDGPAGDGRMRVEVEKNCYWVMRSGSGSVG